MSVHENVYPGPQKEKYVIRRLLRRAVLDGHQLGMREPFLYRLVPAVVEQMKHPYPELTETVNASATSSRTRKPTFFATIDQGLARIEKIFQEMNRDNRTTVDGGEAADLYQTYGVPPEVFESMAAEKQLAFDWDRFKSAMEEHGAASGKASHAVMDSKGPIDTVKTAQGKCEFLGYETTDSPATVKFIVAGGQLTDELSAAGADAIVVLDKTPFYGESGGQVGDSGWIVGPAGEFLVTDTQKDSELLLHQGRLQSGTLKVGAQVTARVDADRREGIRRAHSATHVLHYALQKNLGTHAQQQGSKVDADWLRFDFTNMSPVGDDQLAAIETDVADKVRQAADIRWDIVSLAEARAAGAMMLFGEKYPDPVRMVSMGEFSRELCGGTHLDNTAAVGPFEIITEEGVAAGTRRIVALTGNQAEQHAEKTRDELQAAATALGVNLGDVPAAAGRLAAHVRQLKKQVSAGVRDVGAQPAQIKPQAAAARLSYDEIRGRLRESTRALNVGAFEVANRCRLLQDEVASLQAELAQLAEAGAVSADTLIEKADTIGNSAVVISEVPGGNANLLRQLIDQVRQKTESSAVLLASSQGDDKVTLVAGVTRDLVDKGASAGNWVKEIAPVVGGGGGGKPDMAQAGGKQPERLPEALEKARSIIEGMLAG